VVTTSGRVPWALALAVPAGALALAWSAVNLPFLSREQLDSFLAVYPWVVLTIGLLLGTRFRQGRVVFALVALAIASRVLGSFASGAATPDAARFALAATAFLLPADLAWLAAAQERGTLTAGGARRLVAIAAQPPLVSLLWLSYTPRLVAFLERPLVLAGAAVSDRLAAPAIATFTLAVLLTAVCWARRRTAVSAAFFWAVLGSLAALLTSGPSTQIYLATSGLILVLAVVESTFAMAYRDPLTGLPGRRAFDEALAKLSGRYAIAMVDVDHFKEVNDRYGHDVGDQVLRMLAGRTGELSSARAFRYGGEEFALVFPACSREQAAEALDTWREGVARADFALRGRNRPRRKPKEVAVRATGTARLNVSVSIGVAERAGRILDAAEVVRAADEALYRAKRAGRDRVCS
jgi:diguanylate cyclase (GGDEF)-like protein